VPVYSIEDAIHSHTWLHNGISFILCVSDVKDSYTQQFQSLSWCI